MENNLPEAGAVINVDYKRTDGFIVKLTLRDSTGTKVLERLEGAIKKIVDDGGKPYEKAGFGKKKEVEYLDDKCPNDGGRLIKPEAGTNRPIKCENNVYDWKTKTSSGCAYTRWPNQGQQNYENK